LKAIWLQAQLPESRKEYEMLLRNGYNSEIVKRLKEIIKERQSSLQISEIQPSSYDTPNWAEKQAHNNGMLYILKWVQDLLDFEKN
jgi:hypothetical protein